MDSSLQKNTWNIEAGEKATVSEALAASQIPTPSGKLWTAIRTHYGLPEAIVVDKVQSTVTLPSGWTVVRDPEDHYGRCCIIKDHQGVSVGGTFLKNTGYDYYGRTHFKEDRLKVLGIIAK